MVCAASVIGYVYVCVRTCSWYVAMSHQSPQELKRLIMFDVNAGRAIQATIEHLTLL